MKSFVVLIKHIDNVFIYCFFFQANSFAKDIPAAAKIALLPAVS